MFYIEVNRKCYIDKNGNQSIVFDEMFTTKFFTEALAILKLYENDNNCKIVEMNNKQLAKYFSNNYVLKQNYENKITVFFGEKAYLGLINFLNKKDYTIQNIENIFYALKDMYNDKIKLSLCDKNTICQKCHHNAINCVCDII